mmetsp:Transcript_14079/g.20812  ORF Transcript_14079/g.20812 Transcript_14079/m.20812 type:complete len:186 (-) Transcript_14079:33-590(-)
MKRGAKKQISRESESEPNTAAVVGSNPDNKRRKKTPAAGSKRVTRQSKKAAASKNEIEEDKDKESVGQLADFEKLNEEFRKKFEAALEERPLLPIMDDLMENYLSRAVKIKTALEIEKVGKEKPKNETGKITSAGFVFNVPTAKNDQNDKAAGGNTFSGGFVFNPPQSSKNDEKSEAKGGFIFKP